MINYSFPFQIVDYLHRAGRVGRVGSKKESTVHTFISKRHEITMLNEIEMAVRLNRPLDLNTNVKEMVRSHMRKKELKQAG